MNLREQRKAAARRVKELADAAKAEGREFTDEEAAEIEAKTAEITELEGRIKKADELADKVKSVAFVGADDDASIEHGREDDPTAGKTFGGIGSQFVGSDAYKAFSKSHPSGLGEGTPVSIKGEHIGGLASIGVRPEPTGVKAAVGTKADPAPIGLPDARVQNIRYPTIDVTYPADQRFLDLITRGEAAGAFEYLQIISDTDNADVVADAVNATGTTAATGLKPLSDFETQLADAKPYTYADGFTVTNSMLSDAPALASWMNARLPVHLRRKIIDVLLNGSGTGGVPPGVFNTTGVQQQGPVDGNGDPVTTSGAKGDPFITVRKAITKITKKGGTVTGVLMSVEDDEQWDIKKDGDGRFYSGGPFSGGPGTAWGRPRIALPQIPQGLFICGDIGTIAFLDREGISVLAFNQHADYARRNLTYIRGEGRGVQAIFEPALLAIGDLVKD